MIFSGRTKIASANSHTIHYGKIVSDDEAIDDVLVSVFRAPNSYTGEDSVEISTHGSPLIVQQIILMLLKKTEVRSAEPGEFTKRAFLNNKIDLTQAEAVADVISSRTLTSLRGARNQLDGLLSSKVEELRTKLVNISSFVELELDFSDEEIELIKKKELIDQIINIIETINNLLSSYSFGRIIRGGANLVIVGAPNVGKSSILNYLLKESRAIVSSTPGTTRDTIREEISIDGVLFKIHDTAGFRVGDHEIEIEGIERSRLAIKNADLVLFVGDVEQGFATEVEKEIETLNPFAHRIKVLNKVDLGSKWDCKESWMISAKTGDGMKEFINGLKMCVLGEDVYSERDAIVNNIRHYNCLERAQKSLSDAVQAVDKNLSGEFIATDLRTAELALGEIIGIVTPDDILNNIFSKFCIGK
jgi:tRNA modification GTPase